MHRRLEFLFLNRNNRRLYLHRQYPGVRKFQRSSKIYKDNEFLITYGGTH